MSKLLNLTPVKKSSDVSALMQLYEDCQIRSLELLKVVSDTYGGMVCPILLQMMLEDMALEYSRHRGRCKSYSASDIKLKKPQHLQLYYTLTTRQHKTAFSVIVLNTNLKTVQTTRWQLVKKS